MVRPVHIHFISAGNWQNSLPGIGIDYSAFAIDPDGHALELYYYMEQVGWDGRPRPADLRRQVDNANWPDTLDPMEDTFLGEAFLGPWG